MKECVKAIFLTFLLLGAAAAALLALRSLVDSPRHYLTVEDD